MVLPETDKGPCAQVFHTTCAQDPIACPLRLRLAADLHLCARRQDMAVATVMGLCEDMAPAAETAERIAFRQLSIFEQAGAGNNGMLVKRFSRTPDLSPGVQCRSVGLCGLLQAYRMQQATTNVHNCFGVVHLDQSFSSVGINVSDVLESQNLCIH